MGIRAHILLNGTDCTVKAYGPVGRSLMELFPMKCSKVTEDGDQVLEDYFVLSAAQTMQLSEHLFWKAQGTLFESIHTYQDLSDYHDMWRAAYLLRVHAELNEDLKWS